MQATTTSFLTLSEMLQGGCSDSRIRKAIKLNFAADNLHVQVKVQTVITKKPYEVEGKILENPRVITISQGPRSAFSKLARIFTCCLRYHVSPSISDDDKEVMTGYVLESRSDKLDENKRKEGSQLVRSILSKNQTLFILVGKSEGTDVKRFRIIESTASC